MSEELPDNIERIENRLYSVQEEMSEADLDDVQKQHFIQILTDMIEDLRNPKKDLDFFE